ncbi:hypothetical protein MAR_036298 [Mya arenaria]|uniref:Uncharacterized protein n=1 Tax=Mya arenaria TaxID=6604 RepID=A0ABY7EQ58_MYAAR|nr:hypothetical protein MAR_036298 [Mya arenaria]
MELNKDNVMFSLQETEGMISNTVLSYTSVFGCDTSKEKLGILMLKENESKQLDVIQHLKSLGLSEDKFYIQVL